MSDTINMSVKYAEDIHKVLEDFISFGSAVVSQDIKSIVSDEAYDKLVELFSKYHNANCGPFNRHLRKLIEESKKR